MGNGSYLLIIIGSGLLWKYANSEIFSSIAQIQSMITAEMQTIAHLEEYINLQERRVKTINQFVDIFETLASTADSFTTQHPTGSIFQTLSLVDELRNVINHIEQYNEPEIQLQRTSEFRAQQVTPDESDLTGAIVAIERLQEVYNITAKEFALGTWESRKSQSILSAADCFLIASRLSVADHEQFDLSYEWFHFIVDKCSEVADSAEPCPNDMLATAMARRSYLHYINGNITAAVAGTEKALTFDPLCPEALEFMKIYSSEKQLTQGEQPGERLFLNLAETSKETAVSKDDDLAADDSYDHELFCTLCREDADFAAAQIGKNKQVCKNVHHSPFLHLQSVNVEYLNDDPEIMIFRNFASESETKHLILLGKSLLNTAGVSPSKNASEEERERQKVYHVTYSRTAKNAWISQNNDHVTTRLTRRIQETVGLDLNYAEKLQVANYGIGGHYYPHYDFLSNLTSPAHGSIQGNNDRIATFMLYLTDVEAGGATVFLNRKVTVWPQRGDALFWYNMHRDGMGHNDSFHGGCPVLVGGKWVMNLWIGTDGQEFLRPCLMYPDSHII